MGWLRREKTYNRARILSEAAKARRKRKPLKAIELYRQVLAVEPDNPALHEKLAWVKERRARAAADWHDATEDEMTVPSTIGEERQTNPFMRVDSPAIQDSVRKRYGDCPSEPAAVLGRVREMKDSF